MADPKAEVKPETRELSSLDLVLLENLALLEENNALKQRVAEFQVKEKKIGLQQHFVKRFGIDPEQFEFSADMKSRKLLLIPKKNVQAPPVL
jgi:glycyl-tRNA synthetase (class II)